MSGRHHSIALCGRALAVAVVGLCLVPAAAAAALQPKVILVRNPATGRLTEAAEGRIIVVPRPGASATALTALHRSLGAVSVEPLVHGRCLVVTVPLRTNLGQAMAAYAASPLVQTCGPDGVARMFGTPAPSAPKRLRRLGDRPLLVPNDPLWDQQYGPEIMSCPSAWDRQVGDPKIIIAVIDSGVRYRHPDLTANAWTNTGETAGDGLDNDGNGFIDDVYGWDFADSDNDPDVVQAGVGEPHGTHVAGTAGAPGNNNLGIAGVSWRSKIMAVRVLNAGGWGWTTDIFRGITYATDMGANVINLSLGGMYTDTYNTPIEYAYNRGVVVCAALGNSNREFTSDPGSWFSPVCNDGPNTGVDNHILGVAATDSTDTKAGFSNYSGVYHLCDVSAPGVRIMSTFWPEDYSDSYSGTSMACPHAAGLAALVLAELGGTPDSVIEQIRQTTDNIDALNPLYTGKLGTGRLNAEQAIGYDAPPGAAASVVAGDTPGDDGGSVTTTWRRSSDDGAGHNDVVGYEVWRGSSADPTATPFDMIADTTQLPRGSSSYADVGVKNGVNYYYYVVVRDKANAVQSANIAGPAAARDDLAPPPITTLTARDTPADKGRSISLSWAGYKGSTDLATFRVYRGEEAFTDVTAEGVTRVKTVTDRTARSFVDKCADPKDPTAPPVDQTDYWYAVTALDKAGNETTAVTTAGPAQSAPNLAFTFNSGLQMITLPALPLDPTPMAVFELTDPAQMSFARYDPRSNSYHTLAAAPDDPALAIAPGLGFWMERSVPSFISVGGHVVTDAKAAVDLEQGWNMVGCPYDADYLFAGIDVRDPMGTDTHITASNRVRKYAWRFDPFDRAYKLLTPIMPNGQTKLPAREAMWVYALEAGLKLIFTNTVASQGVATAARPEWDGWQVRLVARTASAADTENLIGVTSAAKSVGKVVGPPPLRGGVDLFLASGGGERLAADLREAAGPDATWQATVQCTTADTEVEVSWPDLSTAPANVRPVLTDLAAGKSVYMRTAAGYRYHSRRAGEKRPFKITLASASAAPVMTQLAVTPGRAGGAELSFVLSRATAGVRIVVLNAAGRTVASLAPIDGVIGLNRVVWSGRSDGRRLPSGRYLLRVTATAADNGETVTALGAVTLGN